MAKVITYSQKYPDKHPLKGKNTDFVAKFLGAIGIEHLTPQQFKDCEILVCGDQLGLLPEMIELFNPKYTTIRKGNRFKAGDFFSPRVWGTDINPSSGRSGPYHSKQIILAPDTKIESVFDIEIKWDPEVEETDIRINGKFYCQMGSVLSVTIAQHDGLQIDAFTDWFKITPEKSFKGQLITWSNQIKYP